MALVFSSFFIESLLLIFGGIVFAEDIRDIRPPVYFSAEYSFFVILAIIILVFATLIFLVVFISKKLRKRKEEPSGFKKPAYQLAYEALEKLKAKNLVGKGDIKEYYFELSNIVRHYIENRFKIKAPEMTTEEFLVTLGDSDVLANSHKELLKHFLSLCDIVKFAKYGPTPEEIENSFNAAKKLVDETKLIEQEIKNGAVK